MARSGTLHLCLFVVLATTACASCPPPAQQPAAVTPPPPCPTAGATVEEASAADAPAPVTSVTTPAITLDLPKASASTRVLLVLGIELAENGNLMVDGKAVADEAELLELAKRAHSEHPDVRAVIRADTRVAHGRVIAVLDAVKRAGIAKIAFAVAPRAVP